MISLTLINTVVLQSNRKKQMIAKEGWGWGWCTLPPLNLPLLDYINSCFYLSTTHLDRKEHLHNTFREVVK